MRALFLLACFFCYLNSLCICARSSIGQSSACTVTGILPAKHRRRGINKTRHFVNSVTRVGHHMKWWNESSAIFRLIVDTGYMLFWALFNRDWAGLGPTPSSPNDGSSVMDIVLFGTLYWAQFFKAHYRKWDTPGPSFTRAHMQKALSKFSASGRLCERSGRRNTVNKREGRWQRMEARVSVESKRLCQLSVNTSL
jgi:hypothetical protein